jgi:hypothetical protein
MKKKKLHTHAHTDAHTYTHIHTCAHMRTHTHTHTHTHTREYLGLQKTHKTPIHNVVSTRTGNKYCSKISQEKLVSLMNWFRLWSDKVMIVLHC